jgi:hypothetical protein
MKKTILKTKLVLHTETVRALADKDLARVRGQGANDEVTHVATGCTGLELAAGLRRT